MREFCRCLAALSVFALFCTAAASAQWSPPEHFELVQRIPAEGERLLLPPTDPLVLQAGEAHGVLMEGAFRVTPDMRRLFAREWGEDGIALIEYILNPIAAGEPDPSVLVYEFEDNPIYIGMGPADTDEDGWRPYRIFSFADTRNGLRVFDGFELPAEYSSGVYAMDLTDDAVLELACPWSTGAGSGGGIELRALAPTGSLTPFGGDEVESSIWSAHGSIGLTDWDMDGDWEIETVAPLLCSACGYYVSSLSTFDLNSFSWVDAEPAMPDYYAEQQAFYRKLDAAVKGLVADPKAYRHRIEDIDSDYAVEIAGYWYSLAPFITKEGELDQLWIDALAEYAEE